MHSEIIEEARRSTGTKGSDGASTMTGGSLASAGVGGSGGCGGVGGGSHLEPFLLLLKGARGLGAVSVLTRAMEAPNVFVFGEFLDLPQVKELADGPHASFLELLKVFAYGTYRTYMENKERLPKLSDEQLKKLRQLTLLGLTIKARDIPYSVLKEELGIDDTMEDFVRTSITSGLLRGKLDNALQMLQSDFVVSRDVPPSHIPHITSILSDWCKKCDNMSLQLNLVAQRAIKDLEDKRGVEKAHKKKIEHAQKNVRPVPTEDGYLLYQRSGPKQPRQSNCKRRL